METIAVFKPEDIFPFVPDSFPREKIKKKFIVNGHEFNIKMSSNRLILFKKTSTCVCCGITGSKFLLQRHRPKDTPHFNFYAYQDGEEILMTKDHIIPIALGGRDNLDNFQTMCHKCNELKEHHNIDLDQLKQIRGVYLKLLSLGVVNKKAIHVIREMKRNFVEVK